MSKAAIILAIESSCDDTSAAILQDRKILSNITANQEVHALYGGVVPELASRAHQQNIIPVVDAAIKKANKIMNGNGRLLVRKSGTEPKIRIMGESHNKKLILRCIKLMKRSIKSIENEI